VPALLVLAALQAHRFGQHLHHERVLAIEDQVPVWPKTRALAAA
jgi:hypothetical protein